MTNEEAREIIKQFRDRQGNSIDDIEALDMAIKALEIELLDDTEQRIFLSAMSRERKVCRAVDEIHNFDPEKKLVWVCNSIERKVKKDMGMTNEEREKYIRVANILIGLINTLQAPILKYLIEKDVIKEALENYIKMPEQQPCEDCISREDAIEKSKPEFLNDNVVRETEKKTIANQNYNKGWNDCNHEWIDILSKLPPVTPSKPKGKWIHWTDDYKDYVTCSCCEYGEEGEVLLSDKTPFCPICGAKMAESEVNADG